MVKLKGRFATSNWVLQNIDKKILMLKRNITLLNSNLWERKLRTQRDFMSSIQLLWLMILNGKRLNRKKIQIQVSSDAQLQKEPFWVAKKHKLFLNTLRILLEATEAIGFLKFLPRILFNISLSSVKLSSQMSSLTLGKLTLVHCCLEVKTKKSLILKTLKMFHSLFRLTKSQSKGRWNGEIHWRLSLWVG